MKVAVSSLEFADVQNIPQMDKQRNRHFVEVEEALFFCSCSCHESSYAVVTYLCLNWFKKFFALPRGKGKIICFFFPSGP
jgi:hypothetical protein